MKWKHKVTPKHLLTEEEDYDSVQRSMNDVADVLEKEECFSGFNVDAFRKLPKGNGVLRAVDYANQLLDAMYDYADEKRIWIG